MSEVTDCPDGTYACAPVVGVLMGSSSDWEVMKHAVAILQEFGVPYEAKVVSAHRMPDEMFAYAESARERGIRAIIAGAGGAAHLPGMLAAKTTVPVLGVPVASKYLKGVDSLHSIVQMPKGVPVATFAIGEAGAANAALFAVSILSGTSDRIRGKAGCVPRAPERSGARDGVAARCKRTADCLDVPMSDPRLRARIACAAGRDRPLR